MMLHVIVVLVYLVFMRLCAPERPGQHPLTYLSTSVSFVMLISVQLAKQEQYRPLK